MGVSTAHITNIRDSHECVFIMIPNSSSLKFSVTQMSEEISPFVHHFEKTIFPSLLQISSPGFL